MIHTQRSKTALYFRYSGALLRSVLNAMLIIGTWVALILISDMSRLNREAIFFASLVLGMVFLRLWLVRGFKTEFPHLAVRVFVPAFSILAVLGIGFMVSAVFAAVLSTVAFLGWIAPRVFSAVFERDKQVGSVGAATELRLLGVWTSLCRRFGFPKLHDRPRSHRDLQTILVLTDAVATIPALLTIVIWPASAVFSGLVLLALASINLWSHVTYLDTIISDVEAPNDTRNAHIAVSAGADEATQFTLLQLENVSAGPVKDFSAEVFQGLCLMFVGASGSGKSTLLRYLATGQAHGNVQLQHSREIHIDEVFAYAPDASVWMPGSVLNVLEDPSINVPRAVKYLQEFDPFEEAFPEHNAFQEIRTEATPVQAKLVALARCFASSAPVLVFNLPELYLDQTSRSAFLALALKAKLAGKILVIATETDEFMSLADELVKFDRGIVTDRGPALEVRERHRDRFLRACFEPTVEEAYRLSLWIDAIMPDDVPADLAERVKHSAEELLLRTPRDQFALSQPVIFDAKFGALRCQINMLDRGDMLGLNTYARSEGARGVMPLMTVRSLADHVGEGQLKGCRQITAVFDAQHKEKMGDGEVPYQEGVFTYA
ncbi:MAG: ATP-binding cassette domain-containing protein [Pseudomonadota bacterium]